MHKHFSIPLFILVLACGPAHAQEKDITCWYFQNELGMTEHANCLQYTDKALHVRPAELKKLYFTDNYASLYSKEHGFMYVNRQGQVVVEQVMEMEMGADYINHGFVRFIRNGKCGYAALLGKDPTIPPQFDGCYPFIGEKALVCNGCKEFTEKEHSLYRGGTSFCINPRGQQISCDSYPQ